jgi:phosphoribosylformimino-5-aminoimidazole carboxamide ribotide isomerase
MIVYPAIDLVGGKCVRLYKGDFAQQTTYDVTPADTAKAYRAEGAEWLHLVDLDGARDPQARQTALVREIIQESGLKVQTGGGVRSEQDVEALLEAGASRVVIGSLAVKAKARTMAMLKSFGTEKICIAMDVQPVKVSYVIAVSGWQESGKTALDDLIREYQFAGLKHVLCTDISRDGTMTGCNAGLYAELKKKFPDVQVQASGGVASLDDLHGLQASGVIIGKALYEGAFTVKQALEAAC